LSRFLFLCSLKFTMRRIQFVLSVLAFAVLACSKDTEECVERPSISEGATEVPMTFLHDSLVNVKSKDELVALLTRYPVLRDYFLHREEFPNDSVFINQWYKRFTNPHIDSLRMEANRLLGDFSALQQELNEAFTYLKHYYPETRVPLVQTAITGFDTDLFVSDSLIIIGIDYYLGPKANYRPNMYAYILRQYIPENIVPSIMLLYGINSRINATNLADKTVLADMIAYGKSYYFAKRMQPCKPDSILINYTTEELQGSRKNQDLIWFRLVEDEVLYSTSPQIKQRYLSERPKTIEVGPECPGRIAQWMGWEIVNSYMTSHPEVSLQELMQMSDANKLFKESKYKPSKK
jgi:hypothetical protein